MTTPELCGVNWPTTGHPRHPERSEGSRAVVRALDGEHGVYLMSGKSGPLNIRATSGTERRKLRAEDRARYFAPAAAAQYDERGQGSMTGGESGHRTFDNENVLLCYEPMA